MLLGFALYGYAVVHLEKEGKDLFLANYYFKEHNSCCFKGGFS